MFRWEDGTVYDGAWLEDKAHGFGAALLPFPPPFLCLLICSHTGFSGALDPYNIYRMYKWVLYEKGCMVYDDNMYVVRAICCTRAKAVERKQG